MRQKLFVGLIICLFCSQLIKAQGIDVRAGLNLSTYLNAEGSRIRPGANLGVLGDIKLSRYFHLQPGLLLNGRGANTKVYSGIKGSVTGYWLDIPLYASFRIPCATNTVLKINAGPYYGVGLFGKTMVKMDGISVSVNTFGKPDNDYIRGEVATRQDLGVALELGVEYGQYLASLGYMQGCTDNLNAEGTKNFLLSLSVGYKFRFGKK